MPAEEAREAAAPLAARAPAPRDVAVVRGALAVKEPEVLRDPAATLAAQGREPAAPREPVA